MLGFCQWLERTPGSIALHESIWGYPIIESVHVLTLCLFLGLAVMLDLRLLGVTMLRTPASEVMERLLPWTIAGFGIMIITGVLTQQEAVRGIDFNTIALLAGMMMLVSISRRCGAVLRSSAVWRRYWFCR